MNEDTHPIKDSDGKFIKQPIEPETEIESLKNELEEMKKREEERDKELRSALLSVVSYLERIHGWQRKPSKSFSGGYQSPYER